MQQVGLYIHVPFCVKKCGYCDFYSVVGDDSLMDVYTAAVVDTLRKYYGKIAADTVYFGGGTPSVLGGKRIATILDAACQMVERGAEITVEANPGDNLDEFFAKCCQAGVNRLSMGLQSANDNELKLLTRRHSTADVASAVKLARANGIGNISLDLMLGIEGQTQESLIHSVDFCADTGANHVSAYMLKIEDGTPFAQRRNSMDLPDDDVSADLYLLAVDRLRKNGYEQYEISNFAKDGAYSRHNLKYWNCDQYIGIGPSAHSFFDGRRFFYERSIDSFIIGKKPIQDGFGGDFEEYAMLRLRLNDGIRRDDTEKRYIDGDNRYDMLMQRAQKYVKAGLCVANDEKTALTDRGFLVSNSIICDLLD